MASVEYRNVECGMNKGSRRPRIPHSSFPIPHFPAGISLLEVLISMFILAVGLLSIATLLPVGG